MNRAPKRKLQNDDGKKDKYNSTISLAIGEVIRFSTDDQFRSQCFQLMKVDNTNDFQNAVKDGLELLTNLESNQINIPARQRLNVVDVTNHEDEKKLDLHAMPEFSGVSMVTLGNTAEQEKMNEFNLNENDTNWK